MLVAAIFGAIIGASFYGLPGALIGGVLGYWGAQLVAMTLLKGALGTIRAQFLNSTFAVMGAICKADGQVTRDEIRVAEELFAKLRMGEDQKAQARASFNRGKAADFDLDAEVARFVKAARGQRPLHQMFLQVQIAAVAADGKMDDNEHAMLMRVARGLGLSETEIRQLEAMLGAGAAAGATGGDGMGSRAGVSREKQLEQAYDVLGLSSAASDAEVKKAYRRQMSQNHPDKLAAKGLPENMREMAEQKTREIGAAYERICSARGIG